MPGEVRLNLPPRLIESARAAQYANRASLDARTEDSKIQAKTVQRRQAAQRQAGLILPAGVTTQAQASQNRAVPDAPQPLDAPRIWRRYRVPEGTAFGVAYVTGYNASSFFWGYLDWPSHRVYSGDGNAYIEFQRTPTYPWAEPFVVTGDWRTQLVEATPSQVIMRARPGFVDGFVSTDHQDIGGWTFLPAGNGAVVAVHSHLVRFTKYGFDKTPFTFRQGPSGTQLTQRGFLVSSSSVREISVGSVFRSTVLASVPQGRPHIYIDESGAVLGTLYTPADSVFQDQLAESLMFIDHDPTEFHDNLHSRNTLIRPYQRIRFGDINAGGVVADYGYGPGVYAYLGNPSAARSAVQAAGSGVWSKQAAAELFADYQDLPGSLADSVLDPAYALLYEGSYPPSSDNYPPINGAENSAWVQQDEAIDYSVQATVPVSDPGIDYQAGSLVGVGNTPATTATLRKVLYWDWGDTDYCRSQLLNLGFTAQDITP